MPVEVGIFVEGSNEEVAAIFGVSIELLEFVGASPFSPSFAESEVDIEVLIPFCNGVIEVGCKLGNKLNIPFAGGRDVRPTVSHDVGHPQDACVVEIEQNIGNVSMFVGGDSQTIVFQTPSKIFFVERGVSNFKVGIELVGCQLGIRIDLGIEAGIVVGDQGIPEMCVEIDFFGSRR